MDKLKSLLTLPLFPANPRPSRPGSPHPPAPPSLPLTTAFTSTLPHAAVSSLADQNNARATTARTLVAQLEATLSSHTAGARALPELLSSLQDDLATAESTAKKLHQQLLQLQELVEDAGAAEARSEWELRKREVEEWKRRRRAVVEERREGYRKQLGEFLGERVELKREVGAGRPRREKSAGRGWVVGEAAAGAVVDTAGWGEGGLEDFLGDGAAEEGGRAGGEPGKKEEVEVEDAAEAKETKNKPEKKTAARKVEIIQDEDVEEIDWYGGKAKGKGKKRAG